MAWFQKAEFGALVREYERVASSSKLTYGLPSQTSREQRRLGRTCVNPILHAPRSMHPMSVKDGLI